MKTAEQWVVQARLIANGWSHDQHLKLVQAIQEDAWRDGANCGFDAGFMKSVSGVEREFDKRFGVKREP